MRALALILLMLTAVGLSACHVSTHLPPGQVKKAVDPPPGQEKKWD